MPPQNVVSSRITSTAVSNALAASCSTKSKSGAAEGYIARYVQAGLDAARRRGLDGIDCGHIHRASLVQQDGLIYANDGDWVESLTALVEERDGTLRLLGHDGRALAELPPRRPAPVDGMAVPRAA